VIAGVKLLVSANRAELEGNIKIGRCIYNIDDLVFPVNSEDIKMILGLQEKFK